MEEAASAAAAAAAAQKVAILNDRLAPVFGLGRSGAARPSGGHKGLVNLFILFRTVLGPPSFLYLSFSISFSVVTL